MELNSVLIVFKGSLKGTSGVNARRLEQLGRIHRATLERVKRELDRHDIDSNVHFYPNHLLQIFRPYTTRLPVAEDVWQRILSVPLYPGLTDAQQDRVIDRLRAFAAGEAGRAADAALA